MKSNVTKIGKYKIVGTLGKGAMGEVYEGIDPVIQRSVAIKTIRAQGSDDVDRVLRERFIREAQAAGVLQHPNIVSIYAFEEDGDQTYIAMELVKGETVADRLRRRIQFSISDTCKIILQILSALSYAHSRHVIHRDIKPGNIMLTDDGTVKITDFGIARIESSDLTQTGTVLGTPGYMSPEQLVGQHIDSRSDLFSTGVLLYEMLTGEKAFDGSTITSVMYKIVNVNPIPPAKLCPNLPDYFDFIDDKAIAKKPENRYQSAEEFAIDIRKILDGELATNGKIDNSILIDPEKTVVMPTPQAHVGGIDEWLEKLEERATQNNIESKEPTHSGKKKNSSSAFYMIVGVSIFIFLAYMVVVFVGSSDNSGVNPTLIESIPEIKDKETTQNTEYDKITTKEKVDISQSQIPQQQISNNIENSSQHESMAEKDIPKTIRQRQIDVAKPGEIIKDCIHCPQLIVIPSGTIEIGSPENESGRTSSEGPQHKLSLNYPFAVGIYEVTKAEYEQFIKETGYDSGSCHVYDGSWIEDMSKDWKDPGFKQSLWHPATCISWQDAQSYIEWLSNQTGYVYRLLSSSEWEYVARAGKTISVPWSTSDYMACDYANIADQTAEISFDGWEVYKCSDNYIHTSPAGSFIANGYGVHDLLGNVFEWVEDCWNNNYEGVPTDGSAWESGDCSLRVLRGGSWFSRPEFQRFAFRNRFLKEARSNTFGFRVARSLN